jgi:signal transduction histidine kinase
MAAMKRLLRTNAVRLAAVYFALFAVSVLALLAFVYLSIASFIDRQTEAIIRAEIRGLSDQYERAGLPGLVDTIHARIAGQQVHATLYLVTDQQLKPLAGNLTFWPSATPVRPGWIRFPVEASGDGTSETDTVLASVFVLSGGYRLLVGRDQRDAQAFRASMNHTLVWAGWLTFALGIAGAVLTTRNMLRRVELMSRTSASIIHGDLSERVPLNGSGDEFDQLAANLNAMLDRIEQLVIGMRQVTDNIAHDMRTPLARLRARLEMALLERPTAVRYVKTLRDAIDDADRLLATFNGLLSIAKAEAGSRRDLLVVVDLVRIARSMAELYEPVAEKKGLAFAVSTDPVLSVKGNEHLLSQAIANLLDNAIKYTPAGAVALSVRRDGGLARIEVADTGMGIPADQRDAVFERFVRLEPSRSTPGNGLGLSLVRAVARLHSGEVRLEDNQPGLKAVFTLAALDDPAPREAAAERPGRTSQRRPASAARALSPTETGPASEP